MGLLKIGAVKYLNTKPLVEGLATSRSSNGANFELLFDLPSRLADNLKSGNLDVALIPSIEASNQSQYTIVSDACIACRGPVWSVKLMSRVEPSAIRSLALDEGSRTSCVLAQIILAKKFGTSPNTVTLDIDQDWRSVETDAALIIGDRAMSAHDEQFPFEMDLGEAWFDWTGLPFVFAIWAARHDTCSGAELARVSDLLSDSRDLGLENLKEIATKEFDRYGLTSDQCWNYLDYHLNFVLGAAEKDGLKLYYKYAAELNLIPAPTELLFHATP